MPMPAIATRTLNFSLIPDSEIGTTDCTENTESEKELENEDIPFWMIGPQLPTASKSLQLAVHLSPEIQFDVKQAELDHRLW